MAKDRCCLCGAMRKVVRIDRRPGSEYPDDLGQGHVRCTNPDCESHKWDDDERAEMSPGRHFVRHLVRHMPTPARKWTFRHRGYVARAQALAIIAGLEFFPWDGELLGFDEWYYQLACNTGDPCNSHRGPANTSAARAMERAWGRPPFVLNGKRLCIGSAFWWADAAGLIRVTSFRSRGAGDAREHYVVCAKREHGKNFVYYKITPAQLRTAARKGTATWDPPQ